MVNVKIVGVGHHLPTRIVKNDHFTNRPLYRYVDDQRVGEPIEFNHEEIVRRSSIEERRWAADGEYAHDLGIKALEMALKHARIKAEDLETILVTTESPQGRSTFPSIAARIKDGVGAANARCDGATVACAGYPVKIREAVNDISRGGYSAVIAAEVLSRKTRYDARDSFLYGDGAGAVILHRHKKDYVRKIKSRDGSKIRVYRSRIDKSSGVYAVHHTTKTSNGRLNSIYDSEQGFITIPDGGSVLEEAIREMLDVTQTLKRVLRWKEADLYIPHQANGRILRGILKRLHIDPSRMVMNVNKYGNMSAATNAVALSEAIHDGRVKKGDKVVISAVGSGLNISGVALIV